MPREIRLDGKVVADDANCYLIAEIGHNHQGDIDLAKKMMRIAKECGADAIKLQKRNNRNIFTKALFDSPYNSENSFGKTYGEHREFLEFGREQYLALQTYAREIGITFFATAFDEASADFLEALDVPLYKIASGDLTNIPLLKHVARFGKPMIVSTGGAELADVDRAVEGVLAINPNLAILQCTACYPAYADELNLSVITTYRERYPELVIGLSDHQNGIAMTMIAHMLGARIVEKHFTLDRASKGTDHSFSLEPSGLRKLRRDLGRATVSLGDGRKKPLDRERPSLTKMSKKLVASRPLKAGVKLMAQDIVAKSPGDGLPPYELERLLGRRLNKDMDMDEGFSLDWIG